MSTVATLPAALLAGLFLFATSTQAQTRGKVPSAYTPTTVDLSWDSLPLGFVANKPSQLADWMERSVRPTGATDKFSKTEVVAGERLALEERIAASGPFSAYLRRDPGGVVRERDTCRLAYDADRELLTFSIPIVDDFSFAEESMKNNYKVPIESLVKGGERFIGTNAHGVHADVTQLRYTHVSIAVVRDSRGFSGSLTIEPERARAIYDRLGCIVVFVPRAPFYLTSGDFRSATLSNPTQVTTVERIVVGSILAVWLVDLKSRAILHKVNR